MALFEDESAIMAEVAIFEVGHLPQIRLDPSEVTVFVGDSIRFQVLRDSAASALFGDGPPSAWTLTSWSPEGEVVIRHIPSLLEPGLFEAVNPGYARITAHLGTLDASGTVTVEK